MLPSNDVLLINHATHKTCGWLLHTDSAVIPHSLGSSIGRLTGLLFSCSLTPLFFPSSAAITLLDRRHLPLYKSIDEFQYVDPLISVMLYPESGDIYLQIYHSEIRTSAPLAGHDTQIDLNQQVIVLLGSRASPMLFLPPSLIDAKRRIYFAW